MPSFANLLLKTSLGKSIQKSIAAQLTTGLRETDTNFYPGGNMSIMYRDRYDYDRQVIFSECLRAWRVNPIARRLVKLTSMFIIGEGITIKSDDPHTQKYLLSWWNHPLNKFKQKCINFCDESTRSGNLFFLCSIDDHNGMMFVRAVPADQVEEIFTSDNDIDQEIAYKPIEQGQPHWPAYDHSNKQSIFMRHYAFNQPVGVPWGEPDLAPMLPWIGRYSSWLEDRARLNRFRFSWLIVWKKKWLSEAAKKEKATELAANPPSSGSWLLLDPDETVEMPAPNLDSADAEKDGLALKKMIAAGAGFPLHYLAEPESSTRTTAEAAGTPTFRGLEQTQTLFLDILADLAQLAVIHRHKFDRKVNPNSTIEAIGPDITERDNSVLSLAVSRIYPAMAELFDREGIDETELLRIVYRMAGEVLPSKPKTTMKRRPLKPFTQQPGPKGQTDVSRDDDAGSKETKESR